MKRLACLVFVALVCGAVPASAQNNAAQCEVEFRAKISSGDLPKNADRSGYLKYCMASPAGTPSSRTGGVVGVWQSDHEVATIRKDGDLYHIQLVHRRGMYNLEFVSPLVNNQLMLGGAYGAYSYLPSSDNLFGQGSRFVRIGN